MATAYEESLRLAMETGKSPEMGAPSHILAADTLNVANGNKTFLESAADVVEDIPTFITASLVSGANQVYNIPANIGNLFGGDYELSDTDEVMAEIDSDLSQFYQEHKEGVDLVGFLASSMIPGTAGVKILNAGQKALRAGITAGKYGNGMGKALGLLAPQKTKWVGQALEEAVTSSSVTSSISRKALRGVMAGMGQNALEALAFESALSMTMYTSPLLENQDLGDFVSNVAWGAGVFGLAGGAIDAAKISYKVKKGVDEAAESARPWSFIPEQAPNTSASSKIALDVDTLHGMPEIPADVSEAQQGFFRRTAEATTIKLENRIRKNLAELTEGDQATAEALFQVFKGSSAETKQSAFIGALDATRIGEVSKSGKEVLKFQKRAAKGKVTIQEIEEFADTQTRISYAKLWGEGAGTVTTDSPILTSLVDTLKKGEDITLLSRHRGVKAGSKTYRFDTVYNKGKKAGTGKPFNSQRAGVMKSSARYIWASKLPKFEPTADKLLVVDVNDIPLMEKVLQDVANTPAMKHVRFTGTAKGEVVGAEFDQYLATKKIQIANRLLAKETKKALTQDEIAAVVNVKSSALAGELVKDASKEFSMKDMLAMQDHAATYTEHLVKQGLRRKEDDIVDIWNIPQHTRITYDTTDFKDINNFVLENMQVIKGQQKLYQESMSKASAEVLGDAYARFEDISSGRIYKGAKPSGAGASYLTSGTHNYGTLAATVENIGRNTANVIETFKEATRGALDPVMHKLANNTEAAIEMSVLDARLRSLDEWYGLNEAGTALEPVKLIRYKQKLAEAQSAGGELPVEPRINLAPEDMVIPIKHQETMDAMKVHIERNGKRVRSKATLRSAQGYECNISPDVYYPVPKNPQDYPHFAMVSDSRITSGNHQTTIYATSDEELKGMIDKLRDKPYLKVRTKAEVEEFYGARGLYEYEKTLSDSYLDTELRRAGVSSNFLPATDPQKITRDFIDWHMQQEASLVREAVTTKYNVQFEELKRLGDEYTATASSKFGNINLKKFSGDASRNPYRDYIKTALAVKKTADYQWHSNFAKMVDEKFTSMYNKMTATLNTATSADDLVGIQRAMEEAGYKGAAYDAEMNIFANAAAPKGLLNSTVQMANSLMATVVLRWDPLNAVNNAVSANVLLGAETKAVIRAIGRGDAEATGALAELTRVKVPGTEETIFAPQKLIANAIKKFNRTGEDFKFYKDNGFMTPVSAQYAEALEDLTYRGAANESVQTWRARLDKLLPRLKKGGDIGEKLTGNKLAEEFNRFVAADVMKQMTDVARERGLMSAQEQLTYINTFVNRTQGNYLASQRPMMFHGAVGQAVGLFQTYQFNLMQQMLRHVGEGHSKDAMTLLALQGTIHGMNGLPAFNAINTHLIGTASGNTEHKDAYDAVYGLAGKDAGDWLMYGVASNAASYCILS